MLQNFNKFARNDAKIVKLQKNLRHLAEILKIIIVAANVLQSCQHKMYALAMSSVVQAAPGEAVEHLSVMQLAPFPRLHFFTLSTALGVPQALEDGEVLTPAVTVGTKGGAVPAAKSAPFPMARNRRPIRHRQRRRMTNFSSCLRRNGSEICCPTGIPQMFL